MGWIQSLKLSTHCLGTVIYCYIKLYKTDKLANLFSNLLKRYPIHIEKEGNHFFLPALEYLSLQEQSAILEEFWEFGGNFIHEIYVGRIKVLEMKGK